MTSFPQSFGFVGLGAMGYPMAVQLRRKLPCSIPLTIYDLNEAVLQKFMQATDGCGETHIAMNAREVADGAVS